MNILKMACDIVSELNQHAESYFLIKPGIAKIYEVKMARKYLKIWYKGDSTKTIVMFIDEEGNIYKPASHRAPAKGVRGKVEDWKSAVVIVPNMPLAFVK